MADPSYTARLPLAAWMILATPLVVESIMWLACLPPDSPPNSLGLTKTIVPTIPARIAHAKIFATFMFLSLLFVIFG
jgi:hypothetical protein